MSRRTKPLICSKSDISALQALATDDSVPRLAVRARMILECAKGYQIKDVAAKFSERPNTVIKWKQRFEQAGIDGLRNAPRGSTKDVYGEPFAKRLLNLLKTPPPDGEKYWTGPLLADALGTPHDTIRRYLRRKNIRLLEYRRRVLGNVTPDDGEDDLPVQDEITPANEQEVDSNSETLAEGKNSLVQNVNDDTQNGDAITDAPALITCKKCLCVNITSSGDLSETSDRPLDAVIQVKLMDGDKCIQETLFSFSGILPKTRHIDVKIEDTS